MSAVVVRPLSPAQAATIVQILHATLHIDVTVQPGPAFVAVAPARHALTTRQEVLALRAVAGVTDAPLRWCPEVTR